MLKRTICPLLASLLMILLFSQCESEKSERYRFSFRFITENYKPLNYTENSVVTGLAPDLLKEICLQLQIPYKVETLPWEEAYQTAQNTPNAVLFSMIMEPERKELFKWAGPIASLDWYFYQKAPGTLQLNSIEDAKTVQKIGVLADYSIEQYLVAEGFTNLVYCEDNVDAFQKLLSGEIDLFPSDRFTAEAALQSIERTLFHVSERITIKTDLVYFAFNRNIPDDVVADFQEAIDEQKKKGTLLGLTRKYLRSSDAPGTLTIYTEQYPPLSFRNNEGEITGFGTDLVNEIMKRNHIYADIKLSSWSNGYNLALSNPNVCLFTMDRTPLREELFHWIGPIGTNTTWIYTRKDSGISIESLDDAKNLSSLGTVSSWFSDQHLRNLGFTNLVSHSDPAVMTQKFMEGEIDAFVCTGVTFPTILQQQGYSYEEVEPAFSLMSSDYYIALSKGTPATLLTQWQESFESMQDDGTYDIIYAKWLQ